ncbi:MAG: SRPBCC family protein [Pseudobdellovibrio sp.]
MSNPENTVRLHRVIKAPPERIYRAFLDADAIAQWIPPYGFTCKVQSMNPIVGGKYQMVFTNFTTQKSHSFGGEYLELIPGKLIKYNDQFDDPNVPGKILVTITLKEVICGTELHIVQENLPSFIPIEMCYLGWQESLNKLAHLVEPEIKD